MTTTPERAPVTAEDVAVGYDASPESRKALRWAAEEAVAHHRRLAVVTVVEPGAYGIDALATSFHPFLVAEAHRIADPALYRVAHEFPLLDARVVPRVGRPTACLADVAREAGILVIGARPRSAVSRLVLGSVARHVLRTTTSPVVLVPRGAAPVDLVPVGADHIAAVIGPAAGASAVAFALAEGRARHRDVAVIRARRGARGGPPPDDEDAFGRGIDTALDRAQPAGEGTRVDLRSVDTTVGRLLELGVSVTDLLVIGDHEPGEARHLLADRAVAAVLRMPRCPVAIVPDDASRLPWPENAPRVSARPERDSAPAEGSTGP